MTVQENVEQSQIQHTVVGVVVSDKMHKTIVVKIERKEKHPLYGKYVKRITKLYAHDEDEISGIGDVVKIKSVRPLSKTKRWSLLEVVTKANKE